MFRWVLVALALTVCTACSDDSPAKMPQFDFSFEAGPTDAKGEPDPDKGPASDMGVPDGPTTPG